MIPIKKEWKMNNEKMPKLLLIGSRQNRYDTTDTGGISILVELLISELKKEKIPFHVIDTLIANNGGKLKTLLSSNYQILKNIREFDHISLQGAQNSFLFIAPFLLILAKIFKKTVSIRLFAGNFGDKYRESNFIKRFLIRVILKNSNAIFFELKHLVSEFKKYNPNTYYFPNVRDEKIQRSKERTFQKRFVYIGSINEEKGIDELCQAIKSLNKNFIVDLYGPIKYDYEKYSDSYFKQLGVSYKGALKSDEVLDVMDKYDVLILPSHREGYPGVIIEAFALGIPVIATKLPGIMEMCENNQNSILIDVKNSQQLLEAIKSITDEQYIKLHQNAKKAFKNFNSHTQTTLFLERIKFKGKRS